MPWLTSPWHRSGGMLAQGPEGSELAKFTKKEERMSSVKKGQKGITRREFAKGAAGIAGVAAVGAVASCVPLPAATPAAPTPAPQKWDKEADVVVVGSGMAALCAAVEAADAGAQVL